MGKHAGLKKKKKAKTPDNGKSTVTELNEAINKVQKP